MKIKHKIFLILIQMISYLYQYEKLHAEEVDNSLLVSAIRHFSDASFLSYVNPSTDNTCHQSRTGRESIKFKSFKDQAFLCEDPDMKLAWHPQQGLLLVQKNNHIMSSEQIHSGLYTSLLDQAGSFERSFNQGEGDWRVRRKSVRNTQLLKGNTLSFDMEYDSKSQEIVLSTILPRYGMTTVQFNFREKCKVLNFEEMLDYDQRRQYFDQEIRVSAGEDQWGRALVLENDRGDVFLVSASHNMKAKPLAQISSSSKDSSFTNPAHWSLFLDYPDEDLIVWKYKKKKPSDIIAWPMQTEDFPFTRLRARVFDNNGIQREKIFTGDQEAERIIVQSHLAPGNSGGPIFDQSLVLRQMYQQYEVGGFHGAGMTLNRIIEILENPDAHKAEVSWERDGRRSFKGEGGLIVQESLGAGAIADSCCNGGVGDGTEASKSSIRVIDISSIKIGNTTAALNYELALPNNDMLNTIEVNGQSYPRPAEADSWSFKELAKMIQEKGISDNWLGSLAESRIVRSNGKVMEFDPFRKKLSIYGHSVAGAISEKPGQVHINIVSTRDFGRANVVYEPGMATVEIDGEIFKSKGHGFFRLLKSTVNPSREVVLRYNYDKKTFEMFFLLSDNLIWATQI